MTDPAANNPHPASDAVPPADLPLIREALLEQIQQLRAAGAPPDDIAPLVADYDHYTALGRRS